MESNSTMSGAVETTCAHTRVWRDRLQPGTRLLADLVAPVQGTTLLNSGPAGVFGQGAVQGADYPAFAIKTSMDVPPFRTGRPPV